MPAFEFQEKPLYCGRYMKYGWKIYDEETQLPVQIAVSDLILAKVALTEGGAPVLDLSSATPLANGSVIVIESRGSVGNPDPANDTPAKGYIELSGADTSSIPSTWAATEQQKRYWLELIRKPTNGEKVPFGRGRLLLHRSPS